MRKILVLTHGHLATGVKSNADLIMGEFGCAHYIDGYLDGLSPQDEVEKWFSCLAPEDEALVFTDFLAGSTTQLVAPYIATGKVHIVTAFNMPMVLEALSGIENAPDLADFAREVVRLGKTAPLYVNDKLAGGQ